MSRTAGHSSGTLRAEEYTLCKPARDCWPRSRWVWPFSCWMSLPGSRRVSRIWTHRPIPNFIRQSFSRCASSLVHPGDGVKFHLTPPSTQGEYCSHRCLEACVMSLAVLVLDYSRGLYCRPARPALSEHKLHGRQPSAPEGFVPRQLTVRPHHQALDRASPQPSSPWTRSVKRRSARKAVQPPGFGALMGCSGTSRFKQTAMLCSTRQSAFPI